MGARSLALAALWVGLAPGIGPTPPIGPAPEFGPAPPIGPAPSAGHRPGILHAQEVPGIRVQWVEGDPTDSVAVAEVSIPGGALADPPGAEGAAGILAALLAAEARDALGTPVLGWAEPDRLALRLLTPPARLQPDLVRLLEGVRAPLLDVEAVTAEVERARSALTGQLLAPDVQAARALVARVFGGEGYGSLETPESLSTLNREALLDHLDALLARGEVRVLVGGIPEARAADLARELRERLAKPDPGPPALASRTPRPLPGPGDPPPPDASPILVPAPGSDRVLLLLGQAVPALPPGRWAALTVGVELLHQEVAAAFRRWNLPSGVPPARARVALTRQAYGGLLRISATVPASDLDRALRTLYEAVERSRRALPQAEGMEVVKARLRDQLAPRGTTEERVGVAGAYLSVGLGPDPQAALGGWLEQVDPYDVRRELSVALDPGALVVVAAGDPPSVAPVLESLGAVEVLQEAAIGPSGGQTGGEPLPRPDLSGVQPGSWDYRVLWDGDPVGTMRRVLERTEEEGPGGAEVWRLRTELSTGDLRQEAEILFDPRSLRVTRASLALTGGNPEVETLLELQGEVLLGNRRHLDGSLDLRIRTEWVPGALLGELLELALWVQDLEVGRSWVAGFVDPSTGTWEEARIRVLDRVEVPGAGGPLPAWRVEVLAGGIRQRLHLRDAFPHLPVTTEILGQPLRLEWVR